MSREIQTMPDETDHKTARFGVESTFFQCLCTTLKDEIFQSFGIFPSGLREISINPIGMLMQRVPGLKEGPSKQGGRKARGNLTRAK